MYLTKSLIPVSRQLKTHTNQSSNQLSIPGFYGGVLKPKCDLYHCELQVLSQVTAFVFAHSPIFPLHSVSHNQGEFQNYWLHARTQPKK